MQEIEMNGIIYEFPDGMSQDDISSALMGIYNQEQYKQENKGYTIEDVKRSLGLGTRDVLTGLGSLTDPFIQPINAINEALGGQADYFATNAGESLSNALNLPTPQTQGENIASMAIQGGASAVPFIGAGNILAKGSNAVSRGVGATLAEQPIMQGISSVTAGGAMGGAQNADLGAVGQLAAGIGGALVPSVGAGVGKTGLQASSVLDSLTPGYAERKAGTVLDNMTRDSQAVQQRLRDSLSNGGQILEGSQPTLAQIAQDPQVSVFEKGVANKGDLGGNILERYAQQADVRRGALNPLVEQVNARNAQAMQQPLRDVQNIAPFIRIDSDDIISGRDLRNQFNQSYDQARQQTRNAYENIDPQGTASFDIQPLLLDFANVAGESRYQVMPKEINSMITQMQDDVMNGVNVSYRDLQAMRTQLSDMQQNAMTSGDSNLARISGTMKGHLDDYINRSGNIEMQGSAPTPQRGTSNYNAMTRQATEMTQADPYFQELKYLAEKGLNRAAMEDLIGFDGVRDLNSMYPNLIRKSGTLQPDDIATQLQMVDQNQIAELQSTVTADDLIQVLKDRLGGRAGRYRQAYTQNRDNLLAQDLTAPHTGFTPEQAQLLKEAQALRTQQGQRFEQGANLPLTRRGERTGGQAITDGQIVSNYLKPGAIGQENVGQLLSAVDNQEVRNILLDRLISRAVQSSSSNGVLDPIKLQNFVDSYGSSISQVDPLAKNLLREAIEAQQGNINAQNALNRLVKQDQAGQYGLRGVQSRASYPDMPMTQQYNPDTVTMDSVNAPRFTDEELTLFNQIRDDQIRADQANRLSATAGSQTGQLNETMKQLGLLTEPIQRGNGLLDRALGGLTDTIMRTNARNVDENLARAVLDPEYALSLYGKSFNNMTGNPLTNLRNMASQEGFGLSFDPFAQMLRKYGVATSNTQARTPLQLQPQEEN